VCFLDAGHVPRQRISPQSCPQPMWIVLAVCHARLHIPAGILRIPVFSVLVALFPQESRFLFRRNFFFTSSEIRSVPGLRT
jgi:hypothetical protein